MRDDYDSDEGGDSGAVPISYPEEERNDFSFIVVTIILPIFGCIIVFVLIFVAVRILKNDSIANTGNSKLNGIEDCCNTGIIVGQNFDRKWSESNLYNNNNGSGKSLLASSMHSAPIVNFYLPLNTNNNNTNDSASLLLKNDKNNKVLLDDSKEKNDLINLDYRLLPQNDFPATNAAIVNSLNKGLGLDASLLKPNLLLSASSSVKCECYFNNTTTTNTTSNSNNLSRNAKCNHCNVNVQMLNEKNEWN